MDASTISTEQVTPLDPTRIRADFPILTPQPGEQPIAYLDSAASSQKPQIVIDAIRTYYERNNANVHRGVYALAERSTEAYEQARKTIAHFFNTKPKQIIFTRNTTEAINLVARTWADASLKPADVIVLSEMEHHSNLVPWQLAAQRTGATLEFMRVTDDGQLHLDDLDQYLATGHVKLVATCHVSNMLGTINPIEEIIARAHNAGALVLLDGAQAAPHLPVDLSALDVDFYTVSGHKMCGPMGSGFLFGKLEHLESMPPFLGGGDMIRTVGLRESTWANLPAKFEAGTPSVADAVGFAAACDYLTGLSMAAIRDHETELTAYAYTQLLELPDVTIYGPPPESRSGAISFNIAGAHPHDVASILDEDGVCVRAGHHCTQPLHARFDLDASARASFYLYNTHDDIDRLVDGLRKVRSIFA